jgi:hypothetical protein
VVAGRSTRSLALMSSDTAYAAARQVVDALRASFPKEAVLVDQALLSSGYEDAPHTWVERFSQCTTDAIGRGEFSTAEQHLKLVSTLLAHGDENTHRCVDVAYVESLMWDIKDEKIKRQGWRLIPANLRTLYMDMWGEKPFMKGAK